MLSQWDATKTRLICFLKQHSLTIFHLTYNVINLTINGRLERLSRTDLILNIREIGQVGTVIRFSLTSMMKNINFG